VNLSYAQSFFCRCREYGDGHYFPPAMNCPFKSFKPLFWFFTQSDDRNHFSVSITVVLQDSAWFRAQIFK
jgi:hypothetical protein